MEENGKTSYRFDKNLDKKLNNHVYIGVTEGEGLLLKDNFAYTATLVDDGAKDVLRDISLDDNKNIISQYPK